LNFHRNLFTAETRSRREILKKFLNLKILFLAILFLTQTLQAAEPWRSVDPDTSIAHLPTKWVSDLSNLFIPENGLPLVVGGFVTASDWAFFDQQDSLAAGLKGWNTPGLFDFGNFYGEGWVEGGTAVGGWALGAFTEDARLQEFGRDATESVLTATLVVTGLKYAVGRERPDGSNNLSFPSGHSIVAFSFAPVVAKYGGWELGVPAYAFATVTALARVEGYHHYLSDVVAGATMGILIGNAVVFKPKDLSVSVLPGQVGLTLRFN
jgi:membrane-associated phospholipid phosphatase